MKQRQNVILIADKSEMGWKVVEEHIQSEVASDEEDQKRIHSAHARPAGKQRQTGGIRRGPGGLHMVGRGSSIQLHLP